MNLFHGIERDLKLFNTVIFPSIEVDKIHQESIEI